MCVACTFFAQSFEVKMRMHIVHGCDDYTPWYVICPGCTNGYIMHTETWVRIIHGTMRHLLTVVCGCFPGAKADLGQNWVVVTACISCTAWHSLPCTFQKEKKANFCSNPPLPAKKELKLLYNLIISSVSTGRIVPLFLMIIFIKYIYNIIMYIFHI